MRAFLLFFTRRAVFSPVETIVFFSVVGTLAYFRLLSTIKYSAFFASPSHSTWRTTHALFRDGDWIGLDEESYKRYGADPSTRSVELQQLIFSLQSTNVPSVDTSVAKAPVDLASISRSIDNMTRYITHDVFTPAGRNYSSFCYHAAIGPHPHPHPHPHPSDINQSCFTALSNRPHDPRILTLSFRNDARQVWVDALKALESSFSEDVSGVKYRMEGHLGDKIRETRSSKWIAYASRALVIRFWELAKKADSLDILFILAGYIFMHGSFIRLFLRSRALGSNFWLSASIVCSAVFAFLLALPLSYHLDIPLDPISLTEALPFLVSTVGFDKPLRLATAVFNHRHLTSPVKEGRWRNQMKPASEVVLEAMEERGNVILCDYALEIAVLTLGAKSKVGGLQELCAFAALALTLDCVLFWTFYAAVLTIKVEVRRIQAARILTRSRSSNNLKTEGRPSSLVRSASPQQQSTTWHKISNTLLGAKGAMLGHKNDPSTDTKKNPVARLKLLLIVTFLALHVLNFTTTLTPATVARYDSRLSFHPSRECSTEIPKVDIKSPAVANVLKNLGALHRNGTDSQSGNLLVQVAPPIYIHVIPPSPRSPRASFRLTEAIENFMTAWTVYVGDPLLSKWIVLLLAASLMLNGYLLKGIADGAIRGSQPLSVRFLSAASTKKEKDQVDTNIPGDPAPPTCKSSSSPIDEKYESLLESRGLVNIPDLVSLPTPVTSPVVAPVAVHASKEDNISALLLNMKLRTQPSANKVEQPKEKLTVRPLEECVDVFENGPRPVQAALGTLNDEEVILLAQNGKIAPYALEKVLGDFERAVVIRRALISRASVTKTLEASGVPYTNYDYSRVLGACCENVIGYIPIPLGVAGPLKIDGQQVHIPMATAEGTLVASTSRGCKALNAGGGVVTVLTHDAMTRGPAIDFPTVMLAAQAKAWVDSDEGFDIIRNAFESTSRFAKLQRLKTALAGRTLFVRFATTTGDAMGMNMISKGTEKALEVMQKHFPDMVTLALSGNYCTDKKPAAINWIEGRGKSVVAEAIVPGKVVKSVLKTTVEALCNLNTKKNLVGSAMAGSIGGFNAHAANILTAVFLATGQDPAQNVESSNCMTLMEPINDGEDLLMTVTMPSIEVGTVGGGTVLAAQGAVLEMLGLKGPHPTSPGHNAQRLARIIAAAVMAGELSLLSALAAGHLVRAHLVHNRSQANTPTPSRPVTPGPVACNADPERRATKSTDSTLPRQLLAPPPPPYSDSEERR